MRRKRKEYNLWWNTSQKPKNKRMPDNVEWHCACRTGPGCRGPGDTCQQNDSKNGQARQQNANTKKPTRCEERITDRSSTNSWDVSWRQARKKSDMIRAMFNEHCYGEQQETTKRLTRRGVPQKEPSPSPVRLPMLSLALRGCC